LASRLQRVTDLQPTDTEETPYYYTFKVQCTSCREVHDNWVGVSRHVRLVYCLTPIVRGSATSCKLRSFILKRLPQVSPTSCNPSQSLPPILHYSPNSYTTTDSPTIKDDNEISGSRGSAHFVWRCKNCKREHSASVKDGPFAYDAEKGGRQKVLEIDNRGLEFVEFRADVRLIGRRGWSGCQY